MQNQGDEQSLLPLLPCEYKLNCAIFTDPKEIKRQRNREWYARNKDDISKRRRQARELKNSQ